MRALALLVCLSVPAVAQTVYSWEDADGVHYTDDPTQVPKQATVSAEHLEKRPVVAVQAVAASPSTGATAPQTVAGQGEREWRERFITAHRRIKTLQQSVGALRGSLPPSQTCVQESVPVSVPPAAGAAPGTPARVELTTVTHCRPNREYERLVVRIGQEEVALRDAQTDLEQLDRRASYDGVPREWRRGW